MRSAGAETIARKPASRSSSSAAASPSAFGRGSLRTCSTHNADQRNVPAVTAKTADGPLTASTTPPIAGPTRKPTLAIVLIATFADVSSSGVVASDGSNAACAGGKAVETIETKTASA